MKFIRFIMSAVFLCLALMTSFTLEGCATTKLWNNAQERSHGSLEVVDNPGKIYAFDVTGAYLSENQKCFSLSLEGGEEAEGKRLYYEFDYEVARKALPLFRGEVFSLTLIPSPHIENNRIGLKFEAFLKEPPKGTIEILPKEPSSFPKPEAGNGVLDRVVALAVWGEVPRNLHSRALAWVDSSGEVVADSENLELKPCADISGEGLRLAYRVFTIEHDYLAAVSIPAETVCNYNCNVLGDCSDFSYLWFDEQNRTGLSINLPVESETFNPQVCGQVWTRLADDVVGPGKFTYAEGRQVRKVPTRNYSVLAGAALLTPFYLAWDIATSPVQLFYYAYFEALSRSMR